MTRRVLLTLCMLFGSLLQAQNHQQNVTIPHLIKFSGLVSDQSVAKPGVAGVMFALYKEQQGGAPLWQEQQNVSVDSQGRFTVMMGANSADGVPSDLFVSNEARWLGVRIENEAEQSRVLLVSVPYAMKAGDAETVGGLPPSAFVLAQPAATQVGNKAISQATTVPGSFTTGPTPNTATINANFLALFADGSGTLTSSNIFQQPTAGGTFGYLGFGGITTPLEQITSTGNIRLQGGTTHFVQVVGNTSSGRLGQDNVGFFFASDTPDKKLTFYTKTGTGPLLPRMTVTGPGNVGIGTASPLNALSVVGTVESTSGGFKFPDGSTLGSANGNPSVTTSVTYNGTTTNQIVDAVQNQAGVSGGFNASGVPSALVGTSTTNMGYAAGVFGSASSIFAPGVAGVNLSQCDPSDLPPAKPICKSYGVFGWSVQATRGAGVWGQADSTTGDNVGSYGQAAGDNGTGVFGYATNTANTGFPTGVYGRSDSPSGVGTWGDAEATSGTTIGVYGNVISAAGYAGEFDAPFGGNILAGFAPLSGSTTSYSRVFRVDATGKGYFDGGTATSGADFAESVDAIGGVAKYQPGDVMMIDSTGSRRLALANRPYSTKVAGIYSTKPGVLASPHKMDDARLADEVPLAIVGIVPCKVSAENGPIRAGDLLVTATRPGYAMKGTDRRRMLGAVVGKALGPLDKGTGVIEVLVSLH